MGTSSSFLRFPGAVLKWVAEDASSPALCPLWPSGIVSSDSGRKADIWGETHSVPGTEDTMQLLSPFAWKRRS